ncbi:MAG TPA: lysophospholipid acyltransferase family protein [Thermoanaerobaculia bacterium]|jgi:1-acyl-sn-glycerol-3-phosphate acyltransferase|nr:lysophospholipid acyltransferase family protein [Thermoanaerobaculia bacterium]
MTATTPQADGAIPAPRRALGSLAASLLATVTGNLFLVLGSVVFATLTVLFGWIPLPHGSRVFYPLVRVWSRLLLLASGVRLRSEQEAPLTPGTAYVFLSNHQSLFDIPVLLATLPLPARFMAKRELFRIPIFGWGLRVGGFIPVARGSQSARDSFRAGSEKLQRGQSVLLFPEETRSEDGRLLPFKRGGFLLAQRAGRPVVPVGIGGTIAVRPRSSFRIHPGRVLVRYGAPIDPAAAGRREGASLQALVRDRIAQLAGVEAPPVSAAVPEPADSGGPGGNVSGP